MNKHIYAVACLALLLAMLVSAGNFLFGNLAVREIPPIVLTFWRCFIGALCVLPFVITRGGNPWRTFRDGWLRIVVLALVGVVICPWLIYVALQSNDLIDLGAGYTSVPLLTILFSALLISERLSPLQYAGVAIAVIGALVFAFRGSFAAFIGFEPHQAFLVMIASNACRGLYLVLLRRWDMHPRPEDSLFAIFAVSTVILLPVFIAYETTTPRPFAYSWQVWGAILYVGIGMGAIYLHLLNFGTETIGASRASLFAYLVPLFVAMEAVIVLGSDPKPYQLVGGVLIIGGVLIATRLHPRPAPIDHPPH